MLERSILTHCEESQAPRSRPTAKVFSATGANFCPPSEHDHIQNAILQRLVARRINNLAGAQDCLKKHMASRCVALVHSGEFRRRHKTGHKGLGCTPTMRQTSWAHLQVLELSF